jgi:hypothetical protein
MPRLFNKKQIAKLCINQKLLIYGRSKKNKPISGKGCIKGFERWKNLKGQ